MVVKVCVIGAGVVALTTATLFQEAYPEAKVEILSDKFLGDTVSCVAAGIFKAKNHFGGASVNKSKKWLRRSYKFYNAYLDDPSFAKSIGVKKLSGYLISSESAAKVEATFVSDIVDECRPCTAEELSRFPTKPKYGTYLTTVLVECSHYLPYLQKKFLSNGGKIRQRRIESFEELASEEYDLVFNCSGLGARELCKDYQLNAMRGQVYKVSAPWLNHFLYDDHTTYILPGFDAVTIGGTRQFDDFNVSLDKYDSASIWEKCTRSMPALKNAKIIRECAGLRPFRSEFRIESEDVILSNGKPLRIVHNYGHGEYGVMSAPGTSMDAVELGSHVLNRNGNFSKL